MSWLLLCVRRGSSAERKQGGEERRQVRGRLAEYGVWRRGRDRERRGAHKAKGLQRQQVSKDAGG